MVAGDCVARQHRMVVCRMTLEVKRKMRVRTEPRLKWWKLKRRLLREFQGGGETGTLCW